MERETVIKYLVQIAEKINGNKILGPYSKDWAAICVGKVKGFVNVQWKYEKGHPLETWEEQLRDLQLTDIDKVMIKCLYSDLIEAKQKPFNDEVQKFEELIKGDFFNDLCRRVEGKIIVSDTVDRSHIVIQNDTPCRTALSM